MHQACVCQLQRLDQYLCEVRQGSRGPGALPVDAGHRPGGPNVITCRALVRACAGGDTRVKTLELFQESLDQSLVAKRHHLQRLDQCLCEGRQGSRGPGARPGDAGPRAWRPSSSPTAPGSVPARRGTRQQGPWRRLALDVCAARRRHALKPNTDSYSVLISACEMGEELRPQVTAVRTCYDRR